MSQVLRIVFQVAVLNHGELAGGVLNGGADGRALASIALVADDPELAAEFDLQLIQRFGRAVGRSVVHRHQFRFYAGSQVCFQKALNRRGNKLFFVVDRDQDGKSCLHGVSGGRHGAVEVPR